MRTTTTFNLNFPVESEIPDQLTRFMQATFSDRNKLLDVDDDQLERLQQYIESLDDLETWQAVILLNAVMKLVKLRMEQSGQYTNPQQSAIERMSMFMSRHWQRPSSSEVRELLTLVDGAEYDKIKGIYSRKPMLMFAEIEDEEGKPTSPLKRALYNYDTKVWKTFFEYIRDHHPDFVRYFWQQKDQQRSHYDFQPLFKCYKDLFSKYARVQFNPEIDYHENQISYDKREDPEWALQLNAHLAELGRLQAKLPKHILLEFCSSSERGWWDVYFKEYNEYRKSDHYYRRDLRKEYDDETEIDNGWMFSSFKPEYLPDFDVDSLTSTQKVSVCVNHSGDTRDVDPIEVDYHSLIHSLNNGHLLCRGLHGFGKWGKDCNPHVNLQRLPMKEADFQLLPPLSPKRSNLTRSVFLESLLFDCDALRGFSSRGEYELSMKNLLSRYDARSLLVPR